MAWTRLLHVDSCRLEKFSIHDMPPFIAVSHAWGDTLFPPGIPFLQQTGAKAVKRVLSHSCPEVEHCWIDTFCIDQNDVEDKKRQIPLMGDIYGRAEAVAIVFKTPIGLTQERLDHVTQSIKGALEMYREESWQEDGQKWQIGQRRRCLKDAMDCLEHLTRSPWATRVWTLQEFVLAQATVWIGEDLIQLRLSEELFVAVPDICETLNITECIMGRYGVLYHHYRGMAGARLKLIDRTRVMELLGNRKATEAVDEVFGTMAASGVVVEQQDVKSKEEAWQLWWEEAVRKGHVRWALLPPTSPPLGASLYRSYPTLNCAMPPFSTRHQASSGSGLDKVDPLGPVSVEDGVVTMPGRWVGVCRVTARLGRVHEDANGLLHRDMTLILFANNSWTRSLRVARAFGGGRYTRNKILNIAQVLKHNFYRAKLAVLLQKEDDFRPLFRNKHQQFLWSDFMLLQTTHMVVLNEAVAFLAEVQNEEHSTDLVIAIGANENLGGKLFAVDFGAKNTSDRTILTIVEMTDEHLGQGVVAQRPSPSLHKVGVTAAVEIVDPVKAKKYSTIALSDGNNYYFSIGGSSCFRCASGDLCARDGNSDEVIFEPLPDQNIDHKKRRLFMWKTRQQRRAITEPGLQGGLLSSNRKRRQKKIFMRRRVNS